MSSNLVKRLGHNKWYFFVGIPLLAFALAPFPIGCAMIYPIWDVVRGHPEGHHGTQPSNFVGLWIRKEPALNEFNGQAFYLMQDGDMAGMSGMTSRYWHSDNDRLFIDSLSHCGNCYRGNVTKEYRVDFAGPNQMFITKLEEGKNAGISGEYRRIEITDSLKAKMNRMKDSADDGQSFKGRMVLKAIDHFEMISKRFR